VCKSFYLATLDISQKRIISYHANKDKVTGTPAASKTGKHTKHKMSDADIKAVREHISSFPRVESHYCRAKSQKEYLEAGLNISRMYNLFVDQRANACENVKDTATYTETVSKQTYPNIFNESFNIAFHRQAVTGGGGRGHSF